MHEILTLTKKTFEKYSNDDKTLDCKKLIEAVHHIQSDVPVEHIVKLYNITDVDSSRSIDFKEFISVLTIAMAFNELENYQPGSDFSVANFKVLKEMLTLIIDAYLIFDPECKGFIDKSILDAKLNVYSPRERQHLFCKTFFSESRWDEMVSFLLKKIIIIYIYILIYLIL
jgi:Ca2+-binding EF-hand superfamily protein